MSKPKLVIILLIILSAGLGIAAYFVYEKQDQEYAEYLASYANASTASEGAVEIKLNGGVDVTEGLSDYDLMAEDKQREVRLAAYKNCLFIQIEHVNDTITLNETFNDYIAMLNPNFEKDNKYVTELKQEVSAICQSANVDAGDVDFVESGYDDYTHNAYILVKAGKEYRAYYETEGIYVKEVTEDAKN